MKYFIFALLLPLLANASDELFPHREEVQQQMQGIYEKLANGKVPNIFEGTRYFQGKCITFTSAATNPPKYSAILALGFSNEAGFSLSYLLRTAPNYPSYTSADIGMLQKLITLKNKPQETIHSEHDGSYLKFIMAEETVKFPKVTTFLSADKNDESQITLIAATMGYYCELSQLKDSQ